MSGNITSNVIVPEVLTLRNYKQWSICMKNYLLAQDLWEIVNNDQPSRKEPTWIRKNAAILHAFQISCAPEIFAQIENIDSAKDAWKKLSEIYKHRHKWQFFWNGVLSSERQDAEVFHRWFEGILPGESEYVGKTRYLPLFTAIFENNWDAVMRFLYRYPQAKSARLQHDGSTVLHMAVSSRNLEIVKKMMQIISKEDLETVNDLGETALAVTAIQGTTEIADCLIRRNEKLVKIADKKGMIPVVKACARRIKDMTLYLYYETPMELLAPNNDGNHGSLLLHFCILNEMLDIAWNLLHHYPRLAITNNHEGYSPILLMSSQPSWFPSGSNLLFFHRWMYSCIQVKLPSLSRDHVAISVMDAVENEQTNIKTEERNQPNAFCSMLQKLFGLKQVYKQKYIHSCAGEILRCMSIQLSTLNAKELMESGVIPALFQAVQHGINEFMTEILEANLDLIAYQQRAILLHALQYRQEKFLYNSSLSDLKASLLAFRDSENNNALHLVGKLAPDSCFAHIPGAALQMQRELQWFEAIESIVPECKELMNLNGETPHQIFGREHKELVKRGEEWMKQTAQSYTVVGALIITVAFAAAFTAPGGNDQITGFPMFLNRQLFTVFIASDAISLFSASMSVVMFLGILTSRYSESDFLKSLPGKLIMGLCALFISIAAMMVAFCAAVSVMMKKRLWVVIFLISFASILVIIFCSLQYRLFIEIFRATYGWTIHKRKRIFIRRTIRSFRKKLIMKARALLCMSR